MTELNILQLERFNIAPADLRPSTLDELVNSTNNVSYHLDWLAQMLGFLNPDYWNNLNLSIHEKRIILNNALSCDPEFQYPLDKQTSDYRVITVSKDDNDKLILLDRENPVLYLYGGFTYIFNIEQYPTFEITSSVFGGAIPKEDPDQLLFVIDRRTQGYLIVIPSMDVATEVSTSYYGFDLATNVRETDWGSIVIKPWRNLTDWKATRSTLKKNKTLDSWQDNGNTWFGSTSYDTIPIYPNYGREDNPPDGYVYVDVRPELSPEEDFLSAQYFSYDNEYFSSRDIPELVFRPSMFYDFFGIHGSKGSVFSFNFMADALNLKGFNDDTLEVVRIDTTYETTQGEYEIGRVYQPNDVFIYNHNTDVPALEDHLLQSWYRVKRTYTSVGIVEDYRNDNIEEVRTPRKTIYRMNKDTRNDTIPLRVWTTRDLQVPDTNNLDRYKNKAVSQTGYTVEENSNIYHIRLPLEYERDGQNWQRVNLLAETYFYFGKEDYIVEYAYLAAGKSAAGESVYDPDLPLSKFSPKDGTRSLYLTNKW